VFTPVVYVLTSGCAWRHLPPTFGTSSATAHRRFTVWTEVGLWRRLHRAVLDELGARGDVDWTSAIDDAASVRAKRGIADRAEPGQSAAIRAAKLHVLSDAQGIPLAVAVSGANVHDSLALKPLILGMPAARYRRGSRRRRPVKLRADKAYFSAEHLSWLRERGLVARIARPDI
jgi:transposase